VDDRGLPPDQPDLELKNGTKEATLALAGSGGGQDAADGTDVKASLAQANDVLKKMNFDQMMAKMLDQQKKASADMIKQMTGQMVPGNTSPEDLAAIQQFQQQMVAQMMSALNPRRCTTTSPRPTPTPSPAMSWMVSQLFTPPHRDGARGQDPRAAGPHPAGHDAAHHVGHAGHPAISPELWPADGGPESRGRRHPPSP